MGFGIDRQRNLVALIGTRDGGRGMVAWTGIFG